jgi:signal recognition particle receptor subunit beta
MTLGPMNARILYWGIEGAGKSANLDAIYAKLRPDHRGNLRHEATPIDTTVLYERLPIRLGEADGVPVEIELVTAPSGREQAPTRKLLLDEVSGIVVVLDPSAGRADENIASCQELVEALARYGRAASDIPIVLQYNKQDVMDPHTRAELERRVDLPAAATFEGTATDGTAALQTLTTLSKQVLKALRAAPGEAPPPSEPAWPGPERRTEAAPADHHMPPPPRVDTLTQSNPFAEPAPVALSPAEREARGAIEEQIPPTDASARLLEDAIAAEALASEIDLEADDAFETAARATFDESYEDLRTEPKPETRLSIGPDLRVVSVGTATRADARSVRVPLVLGDAEGATASLSLTISIEALLEDGGE